MDEGTGCSRQDADIIGGSKSEHLVENIAGLDVTLSDEQIDILNTAGNPDVKKAWLH